MKGYNPIMVSSQISLLNVKRQVILSADLLYSFSKENTACLRL